MTPGKPKSNGGPASRADDSQPDLKWVVEWLVEREGQRRTAALLGVNRKTVALALRRERLTGRMTLAVQRLMANLDDAGWERTTPLDRLEARMRLAIEAVDDLARLVERLTRCVEALEAARQPEDDVGDQAANAPLDSKFGGELFKGNPFSSLNLTFTLSYLFDELRVAQDLDGGEDFLHMLIRRPRQHGDSRFAVLGHTHDALLVGESVNKRKEALACICDTHFNRFGNLLRHRYASPRLMSRARIR